jgi:sulfate permease, SulP family
MIVFRSFAGWRLADLGPDLAAGLTLAAIAIPEQMATARLGSFPPLTGFVVFIAGTVGFAVLGSNRVLSAGADSTITPIFAGSLLLLASGDSAAHIGLAMVLAVMTGAIVAVGGVFRLGWIADLLSIPVMTGFLAGIAVHIAVSQLPTLLGLPGGGDRVIERLTAVFSHIAVTNFYSLGLGAGVFAVIFAGEKIDGRIPGALIGLVFATLLTVGLDLEKHGVATIGNMTGGLPSVTNALPATDEVLRLLPLALIVAAVVMIQTAATTRAFADGNDPPDVSRDFIGVGFGGILSGLAGGFAVNASPPRTGAVSATGGRSQLAGLAAAAIVAALLFLGTALLAHIPTAALAGVLFFVAQRIVRGSVFAALWRQSPGEFALIIATMAAIVILPIQTGVGLGILLSLLHGIWTITRVRPVEFERIAGTTIWWPTKGEKLDGLMVLGFQAPLAFLNAEIFSRGVRYEIDARPKLKLMVLEASSIAEVDYTAAQSLIALLHYCRERDIDFAVSRLESIRAQKAFDRYGLRKLIGEDHFFHSVDEAVTKRQRPSPSP